MEENRHVSNIIKENLIIRNAHKEDIDSIMLVEKYCFSECIQESKTTFLERLTVFSDGFFVLELNNNIIGYMSTELWKYDKSISNEKFNLGHSIKQGHISTGNELYISSIGVLPEYRGFGLGRFLFQNVIKQIRKTYSSINSYILIVSEKWYSAKSIYTDNGFTEIMTLHNFFSDRSCFANGIVMRKFVSV